MNNPVIVDSPPLHLHHSGVVSDWVKRWSHLVRPGGRVLDVACGMGRHAYWFHGLNHAVVLVDRAQAAIDSIALPPHTCEKIVCDIENSPWPFIGRHFEAIVVTNYLWRPLLPILVNCLAPGGTLIYETFAQGNETVGKPSRLDFLLCRGELLGVCQKLVVVAFEDGFMPAMGNQPERFIQRIAAVKAATGSILPLRYPLG